MSILWVDRCSGFARHFTETRDPARGDGSRLTIADCPAVRFDYWDHFRSRAGQKAFICDKDNMPRVLHLGDLDSEFSGYLKCDGACNPAHPSRRDWRRENLTA